MRKMSIFNSCISAVRCYSFTLYRDNFHDLIDIGWCCFGDAVKIIAQNVFIRNWINIYMTATNKYISIFAYNIMTKQ